MKRAREERGKSGNALSLTDENECTRDAKEKNAHTASGP